MARAVAGGLVRGEIVAAVEVMCSSRSPESGGAFLAEIPGAAWTARNAEVVQASDPVLLALKPQQLEAALPELREASAGKLFVSLAAGISLEKIAGGLAPSARVIRVMPNTPLRIGAGASVYALGPKATPEDEALVRRIFGAAGKAWRVEEAQIDAVTALSGSGPAYVFHFLEAVARAGMALGLPEELARELTLQTVLGATQLAAQSALPPLALADEVKSPRGTTLAACAVLEENDALNALMARCLAAARARARELAGGRG